MTYTRGHATAPAIKPCGRCGARKVDIRKRSTFGIGFDGRFICARCIQAEHRNAASQES